MKRYVSLFALIFVLLTTRGDARAQIDLGAHVGYDLGDIEELFLGVEGRIGLGAALPIVLNPSIQYFFTGDLGPNVDYTFIEIDINGLYPFGIDNQVFTPYAGAGLGIARSSVGSASNTDIGLNLIGGAIFGFGQLRPYAQLRYRLGDFDLFTVQGGILIRIGP